MGDLFWTSMTELARMIATKTVSPVEVVRAHLERIAALDGGLKSYITVCAERALDAARAAEAKLVSGEARGPLHGVPYALKDLYDTVGVATTGGSRLFAHRVPTEDATVVRRLGQAGGVLLGKLNMVEFAYGPEGLNPHYGHCRNPWDRATHRLTGGSSSGAGAAVAAGLAPGALGSDTGGSIRIPASLCGITGLKPTYGRVSRSGVLPLAWSMDHAGPMTRSAADCALLLGVLAGYDPADPSSSVLPVPDYTAALTGDVKGLRIGLLRGAFVDVATGEVRAAVEAAARTLAAAGAHVDEVDVTIALEPVAAAALAIVACEALTYHARMLRTQAAEYDPAVARRLRVGAFVSGVQYLRAQQARVLVRAAIDGALARRDVLLAPTTPMTAPPLDAHDVRLGDRTLDVRSALLQFTRAFNLSGHPACSIPAGFGEGGLPIGLQLIGRPFDEATVLRAADAFQRLTDFHTQRPVLG
jgi:aspartyl-tRNA(Asn)/glutamyl-tRNA(Gln) amidotransferase subunit A